MPVITITVEKKFLMEKAEVISLDSLYKSMTRCVKNVIWKPSVSSFSLNWLERLILLEKELNTGTYKGREPKPVLVTYPKRRECLCIPFRDRVYQRSLNDNVLYPRITKSFIYNNCACQKGKGTDFARNNIKSFLRKFYINNGNSNVGYVVHIDIKSYYKSMKHDLAKDVFAKYVPSDISEMANTVLDSQYSGDTGFNPGSQMVQIAGIAVLSTLDHFCKENLHLKYYLRYMDDFIIIHKDYETLVVALKSIEHELSKLGFRVHPNKTKIFPLKQGFLFLGFTFKITQTGKVLMLINGKNVKHEKQKLKKMVRKAKLGLIKREKVLECYTAWKAHASAGTTYKTLQKMDKFYSDLWR